MSTEYDLSNDELQQTLASIEIPACPAVVMQVMAEAQKDAPDLNVLSKIIVGDVGMSAFAIKLANSSGGNYQTLMNEALSPGCPRANAGRRGARNDSVRNFAMCKTTTSCNTHRPLRYSVEPDILKGKQPA